MTNVDRREQLDPVESDLDLRQRRRPTRLLAFFLLVVMLCTVASTPVAVVYQWYRGRTTNAPVEPEADQSSINRIAFIMRDGQLATIAPDGSDRRRLTDENRLFQFPAWSPDGSHLAVLGGDSLYVLRDGDAGNAANSIQTLYRSTAEPPFYLYWAPDSSQISFLTNHPDGIALRLVQVGNVNALDQMLAVGQPFYWDWSPSGNEILIHTGFSGEGSRLALIDPAFDGVGDNIADPGFFQAPGISSSGKYRAFAEVDSEGRSMLVLQDLAGNKVAVEPHQGQVAMGWSPTEDILAYTSPAVESTTFFGPLRLLDPNTGSSKTLSQDNVIAYFWSPDGRQIAFVTVADQGLGGVQAGVASPRSGFLGMAQVQRIRHRFALSIVDIEDEQPRLLATFEPTNIFVNQFLPFFDQYSLSHRVWAPDSSALVMPMLEDDVPRIVVVPANGDELRPLAEGVSGFWSHQ